MSYYIVLYNIILHIWNPGSATRADSYLFGEGEIPPGRREALEFLEPGIWSRVANSRYANRAWGPN